MKIAIDKDGFLLGYDVENNKQIAGTEHILIDTDIVWPYQDTLLKPKWTGSEWVEGASSDEIKDWFGDSAITVEPTSEQKLLNALTLKVMELEAKTNG